MHILEWILQLCSPPLRPQVKYIPHTGSLTTLHLATEKTQISRPLTKFIEPLKIRYRRKKEKKPNRTNHNNWSIRAASFARSSGNTTARLSHCCWSFSRKAIAHTGTWVTALARANGQTVGPQTWENYQLFSPKRTTLDVHKHLIANITPFPPKKPSI